MSQASEIIQVRDDDLKSITSDFDESFWWSEASVERVAKIVGMGLGDKYRILHIF